MIHPSDWALIGLGVPGAARFGVPTAPASLPMRETTELFPGWAADPPRALDPGEGCAPHRGRAGGPIAAARRIATIAWCAVLLLIVLEFVARIALR